MRTGRRGSSVIGGVLLALRSAIGETQATFLVAQDSADPSARMYRAHGTLQGVCGSILYAGGRSAALGANCLERASGR